MNVIWPTALYVIMHFETLMGHLWPEMSTAALSSNCSNLSSICMQTMSSLVVVEIGNSSRPCNYLSIWAHENNMVTNVS
jgi:hypothetical protein